MFRIVAALLLFCVPGLLPAAVVTSDLSPDTAYIGDVLTYELRIDGLEGKTVQYPLPSVSGFELLGVDSSNLKLNGALRYHLAVYDTGRHELPELPVILGTGLSAETLYTDAQSVSIRSVLPDSASTVRALKPLRDHPFQLRELLEWVWLPVVLLLALAAWFAWRWFRKRSLPESEAAPQMLMPPDQLAVRELIHLKEQNYPARGMLKEFFSELSEILRRYLEKRYEFPALEMTTFDLDYELEDPRYPAELRERLLALLRESDLVKFAKFLPDFQICDDRLEAGFGIVELTKPRDEEPEDTGEVRAA